METHRPPPPPAMEFELLVLHLLAVTLAPHHFSAISPQALAGLLVRGLDDSRSGPIRLGLDGRHPALAMALAFWGEMWFFP